MSPRVAIATLIVPLLAGSRRIEPQPAAPKQAKLQNRTTPSGLEMARLPAGTFFMISDAAEDEEPVHEVELDAFWSDHYEVTQGQYVKLMGTTHVTEGVREFMGPPGSSGSGRYVVGNGGCSAAGVGSRTAPPAVGCGCYPARDAKHDQSVQTATRTIR